MSRYGLDYKIDNDKMNYSIIGHEGMKKSELVDMLEERLKKDFLHLNKQIICNAKDEPVGFFDTYKYDY